MKKFSLLLAALVITVAAWTQDVTSAYNANKAGEYDKAAMYIEKAIVNPKDAAKEKTWRYRGIIYYNIVNGSKFASQYPDALRLSKESFYKAMEIEPNGDYTPDNKRYLSEVQALILKDALAKYNAGDFCNAATGFTDVKEMSSKFGIIDSAAIFNAAYCNDRCGKQDEALAGYQRSAEIGYEVPLVYTYMSDIYLKQGKKEDARRVLSEARAKNPKNEEVLRAEVNFLLGEEKYAEAESLLKSLTEADPNNAVLWSVLGATYDKLGKTAEMEAAYKKSIDINPNYFDGLFNLGVSFYNKGVKVINEECDKIPPREAAKYDDCVAKSKVDFAKAVDYLERAYAIQPNDKEIMSALKEAYVRTENTDGITRMNEALKK